MTDSNAASQGDALPASWEGELTTLRQVLEQRGWHQDPDDAWCWRWPTASPVGLDVFRAGPLIMFDEEDPALGYLVESPLLHDEAVPILRYRTLESLINILDRVEAWAYTQQAADIDPDHTVRPGDVRR